MPKPAAPKLKTRYVCSGCGAAQARWAGKCPECNEWGTLQEEVFEERPGGAATETRRRSAIGLNRPQKLIDVKADDLPRLPLSMGELARVLGGGIVPGSLVLIGGDPGVGKSTLLTSTAVDIAKNVGPALYVSGEESAHQIKMRAERLGVGGSDLYLLNETNLNDIISHLDNLKPKPRDHRLDPDHVCR